MRTLLLRPFRFSVRAVRTLGFAFRVVRGVRTVGDEDGALLRAEFLARTAREFCKIHEIDLDVTGRFPPGPKVVVMNHLGYVDPLVLAAVLPVLPIAKSEVAAWPFVGAVGRALGVQFIVRGNAHSGFRVLRSAIRGLAAGASVLNFPEGTTSFGDDVLPFHRGIFGAARIANVPVVPVRLRFADRDLAWVGDDAFVPHYLGFASGPGARIGLDILPPLDPRRFADARALADAARAALRPNAVPLAS